MKILWLSAVLSLAFIACKDEAKPQTKEAPPAETVVEETPQKSILKAKVRKSLGEADYTRGEVLNWKHVSVGQRIIEKDRSRTAFEAEVVLADCACTHVAVTVDAPNVGAAPALLETVTVAVFVTELT